MKRFSLLLTTLFLIASVSAVTCNTEVIQSSSDQLICTNDGNSNVAAFLTGYYINSNANFPLSFAVNETKTMTFSITQNIENTIGLVSFSDGSAFIFVNLSQATHNSECQLNPSLVSYSQSIQQNTKFNLPKITFNPSNCPGSLSLTSSTATIQGGIITNDGLQKPVSISSIVQDGVNLAVDTTGLNSQTYQSYLNIQAFNKQFQIPFTIIITTGSAPSSNFSGQNSLPTCSVSYQQFGLTQENTLICSNIQPDVKIIPRSDPTYIIGTGLANSQNQFVWKFKAVKYGITSVYADFYYQDVPVGQPFSQEVRVTTAGGTSEGTKLSIIFTPSLAIASDGDNISIQIVDNSTNNIVNNPELFVDAKPIVPSNFSIFYFKFDLNKVYNFRARAVGYNDLVATYSLQSKPLFLNITPTSGDSSTFFHITTDLNATILVNDIKQGTEYNGVLPSGNVSIRAIKEGYLDSVLNFTIGLSPSFNLLTEFKKGAKQSGSLNGLYNWKLVFQDQGSEEMQTLQEGHGENISFTPGRSGMYKVLVDEKIVGTYEAKGWNGQLFGISPIWWIGVLIFLGVGYLFVSRRKKSQEGLFSGQTRV